MSIRVALLIAGIITSGALSGAPITTTMVAQSFDFSTNTHGVFGNPSGGDLYYLPQVCPPLLPCNPADADMFWANNVGQQGLQDVGAIPLTSIMSIPASGYTRFGVPATIGNSYISLAQAGEPGFYIFFTVTAKTPDSVTIDWIYSDTAPGAVPEPGSLALGAAGILGLALLRLRSQSGSSRSFGS